jgi:hypothetical protein
MATTSGSWRRSTGAAAGAVLLLLGLGAGCGGGGGSGGDDAQAKGVFAAKLKSEGSRLKTALTAADLGRAENFKSFSAALAHLESVLRQTARDLDALQAPDDAAADTAKLADLYRKAAAKEGETAAAAKAGNQQRVRALAGQADDLLAQVTAVTNDLRAKGYQVGVLGTH